MKIKIWIFLIVAIFLSSCSAKSSTILLGEKAPYTRFVLMDGTYKTTEDYKGKYLLLMFWATTCSKSQSVLNDVAEWVSENRRSKDLNVVTINIDKLEREEKVRKKLENPKLELLGNAFSGNDIYDEAYIAYDVGELPTLVLIDPSGKIVGSDTSVDVLEDAFPKP